MNSFVALFVLLGVLSSIVIGISNYIWGDAVTEKYIPMGMSVICMAGFIFIIVLILKSIFGVSEKGP